MSKIEVVVEYVCVTKEKLDHLQFFCIEQLLAVAAAAVQPTLPGERICVRQLIPMREQDTQQKG